MNRGFALQDERWVPGRWSLPERVAWLRRFRTAVARESDRLCDAINIDVHKPVWEAFASEIMPLLSACRWLERHAPRLLSERRLGGGPWWQLGTRVRMRREPAGTVGIIATWNYPVQLLGIQMVQALVGGNRVIVKPSEHSPRSQAMLVRLAIEAGLPDHQLWATDATREAGAKLLDEHRLDHVVFTGSTSVGRKIAQWGAQHLVPTTLELSGRDSAIVLGDADVRLAAKVVWHAIAMNAGQTCLAPRRVLVAREVYGEFVRALGLHACCARPVRLISPAAADRCRELVERAVAAGGRSISGVLELGAGSCLTPCIVVDCPRGAELVGGDHFGPVAAVVAVDGLEDAIGVHRACDQHLATSVFTRSPEAALAAAAGMGVTSVTINDAVLPCSHPAASVGGIGASGWGVSRGEAGLLALTRPVYISSTSSKLRVPMGDPGRDRLAALKRVVGWLNGAGRGREDRRVSGGSVTGGVELASVVHPPPDSLSRPTPQN